MNGGCIYVARSITCLTASIMRFRPRKVAGSLQPGRIGSFRWHSSSKRREYSQIGAWRRVRRRGHMSMRFTEIGQQLRAYRLESGLRAEEIAARLGVSRAALYRYEKGEVIKLDTIKRLAELLKISPLSLLGIGVEYYNRPAGFFERVRQVEETADQILQLFG